MKAGPAPLVAAWLARVITAGLRDRFVLRGSLLTAAWFPGRPAADVDHLLDGIRSVDEARSLARRVLTPPLVAEREEVIWAETALPGLRLVVRDEEHPEQGNLQIDLGWGDPLTLPPAPITIAGNDVLGVRQETMLAWKTHGLVEFGGAWRPKDLLDLVLYAGLPLEHDLVVEATRVAFASRGDAPDLYRRFLFSGEWGRSRGSRRKWETFARRWTGAPPVPPLADAAALVRARLLPVLADLGVTA